MIVDWSSITLGGAALQRSPKSLEGRSVESHLSHRMQKMGHPATLLPPPDLFGQRRRKQHRGRAALQRRVEREKEIGLQPRGITGTGPWNPTLRLRAGAPCFASSAKRGIPLPRPP
ncbi:MAG: hypothetical protein JWQ87_4502 [Candidatus Sulfotelmatobacter sp.]|nr:hypothetical protein [Candidatus Sulfotelmatobacter sp.]